MTTARIGSMNRSLGMCALALALTTQSRAWSEEPPLPSDQGPVQERGIIPPAIKGLTPAEPSPGQELKGMTIIEHLFRRQNPEPAFVNQSGVRFFAIDAQYCGGISGEGQATITIPHPIWGVTNVGSLPVTTAFASQLKSGATVLATQTVASLTPGQEARFIFIRPTGSSPEGTPVKVTRLNNVNRVGCFLSPELPPHFEDPPLTVTVNSNGAAPEAADYQVNNSRTF